MRIRTAVAAMVLAAVGAVVPAAPASAATCPDNGWSILDGSYGSFNASGVNIRTGPSTSCTSVGQGQPGHSVQYDCWKTGSDGYTWSHIYNFSTSKQGWVRDTYLTGNGASVHC